MIAREDPERRLADRKLVELGIDAAELVVAVLVAGVDAVVHIGSGWRIVFTAPKPLRFARLRRAA